MSLENDIQQKAFKSEYQKLIINIIYTSKWLEYRHLQSLKPYDITPEQYNLLRILRGRHPDPATVQYITERMLDKSSNASRLVDKLIAKGLVDRKTCPADRRAVDVTISQKGLDMLTELDKEEVTWAANLNKISTDEAAQLNSALDTLRS